MQYAILGTYHHGQVQLHELPPADVMGSEPCDVLVVFLPKQVTANDVAGLTKTANKDAKILD